MKNILWLLLGILIVTGCDYNTEELETLKAENQRLSGLSGRKDSAIITFIQDFNEIEENLAKVKEKQKIVSMQTNLGNELQEDAKTRIIDDIRLINNLLDENKKKLSSLQKKLKTANLRIDELEKMIERLAKNIEEKDAEIASLKDQLAKLNFSIDSLNAVYVATTEVVAEQKAELNTAWYCYGTFKELKEAGVLTKEGGFVGIGKIEKLREDFNKEYFTKVDITQVNEVKMDCKKAKLVTSHPAGTYKWEGEEGKKIEKITITDREGFWKVSKYLVIVVE
ncbi:MAG: hypothetical protein HYY40_09055 [Bacteroidetes bacterium]|nr:hypothetical protein [Bacteroidota bacterium]